MNDFEHRLRTGLSHRAPSVDADLAARLTAGVRARWRRARRARASFAAGALALALIALMLAAAPRPAARLASVTPTTDRLLEEVLELSDVDDALASRARWDEATAPLQAYRALVDIGGQ
jgi:hypothetical protein